MIECRLNLTEICSQESNWQKASIGSGNGLAPNRRQAIIWTSDDPVQWRFYATPGGNKLNWRWVNTCAVYVCVWWQRDGGGGSGGGGE